MLTRTRKFSHSTLIPNYLQLLLLCYEALNVLAQITYLTCFQFIDVTDFIGH